MSNPDEEELRAGGPGTVVPRGGGEIIGDAPERRVEILSDHEALNATWSRFGPRREGADLHVHRRHTDLFYVLDGVMTVRLGTEGESVKVPAGTLARVPPLVVHGFANETDAELRYLNLHAPGQDFANYLRALRDGRTLDYDQEVPPADGGRPVTEAVVGEDGPVAEPGGVRIVVLADTEEIGVAETSAERGGRPARAHVHTRHVESLYVLEGELEVAWGERTVPAPAGSWIQVPPGVPHACRCSRPVRFLALQTPGSGVGAFVRALAETGDDELAAARSAFDQVPAGG
jgi:quercetin dioxygenase-like cupin family protein